MNYIDAKHKPFSLAVALEIIQICIIQIPDYQNIILNFEILKDNLILTIMCKNNDVYHKPARIHWAKYSRFTPMKFFVSILLLASSAYY